MIIDMRQRTEETMTYSVTNLQAVKSFLAHRQEGAFGIEYYGSKNERKTNFFAHYLAKVGLSPTRPVLINQQATDVECYSVVFKAQSFMPFRFRMQEDFWQLIDKYTVRHLDNGILYLQIMFQHVVDETWKKNAHAQYNAYLDGIEMPSSNESIRRVQQKLATMLRNVRKKPYAIPQVIEKQENHGYYVWIRLLLQGNRGTRKKLSDGIKLAFGCTEYANGWQFKKTANTQEFLTNMQTRVPNRQLKQILCPDEMTVFFGGAGTAQAGTLNEAAAEQIIHPSETVVKEYNQVTTDDTEFIEELTVALKRLKLLEPADVLEVLDVKEGPTLKFVTFRRPENLYLSKIKPRLTDLEVELSAEGISLERGTAKGSLSITLPRTDRTVISLQSLLNSEEFQQYAENAELPFILGVDMLGNPLFADLVKLVHMLTAGQTGSGKSVFLSCLLTVLTMIRTPDELKLYLIDPKRVELSPYKDLPHVKAYTPDAAPSVKILNRAISIMEDRYAWLEKAGVKNITEYNKKFPDDKWHYIVIVMDEFGDLSMQVKLDDYVVRLGQKARAAGIHMILATQRPEVKVVSGLIKANLPTKVGFACSNDHDYRTIFDGVPPFRLLGKGDGAFSSQTNTTPFIRFQAPFDQDETMFQQALSKWDIKQELDDLDAEVDGGERYDEAVKVVAETGEATASILQRHMGIGYTEAAIYIEEMEERGLIGQFEGEGSRKILFTLQEDEPVPIDEKKQRLKQIICETGETRVGELRKMAQINQNKANEYMKQLAEEGWLESPATKQAGYTLLLTEEEREEYLQQFQLVNQLPSYQHGKR